MKKSAQHESRGLKTFFIYTLIVLFFIFISLAVKIFFVVKASKFDERHNFTFTVSENDWVKKVIFYNPTKSSTTTITLKGDEVNEKSVNRILGYLPDATIETNNRVNIESETPALLRNLGLRYNSIKTDLTFLDIFRLAIVAYKTTAHEEQVSIKENHYLNDNDIKGIFIDDEISAEDISIQIVNASGISGLGKRLEISLSRLGCNVISVITSQKKEKLSALQYYGEKTYTLHKLSKLLGFSQKKLDNKQIADIVIIIGDESKSDSKF